MNKRLYLFFLLLICTAIASVVQLTSTPAVIYIARNVTDLHNVTRGSSRTTLLRNLRARELSVLNVIRRRHQAPNVRESTTLSTSAQAYAQNISRTGIFAHSSSSSRRGQGENLYFFGGYANTSSTQPVLQGGFATTQWQTQEADYRSLTNNYANPPASFNQINSAYGHFTAQVWKNVTQVGFGIAVNRTANGFFRVYVVARYSWTPNIWNSTPGSPNNYRLNVLPPLP